MLKISMPSLVLILALGCAGPVLAQTADPTEHQIYEAAKAGHLDQAHQMVTQVLKDHPQSARAHFVAAEIYAREGNLGSAREELATAETIQPGLPKESPQAVLQLILGRAVAARWRDLCHRRYSISVPLPPMGILGGVAMIRPATK